MTGKHAEWHRNIPPARKYATIFAGRNKHVATLVVDGWTDEELEQHANLIAQAPALLKALRELLEFSEYDPTDMPAHEYEACKADAQTRARAAISAVEQG